MLAKRNKVSGKLPAEAWAAVALHLASNPRKVFMLVCAVRGLDWWLGTEWWSKYWAKHQEYIRHRGWTPHWFLRYRAWRHLRPVQYRPLLRLVYSLRCDFCGCRFHHGINHHLMVRICTTCSQDRFVSNAVLYVRYGISTAKLLEEWGAFVSYRPVGTYRTVRELKPYTRDAIDLEACNNKRVFFWRPDVDRLYDLSRCEAEQAAKLLQINRLKACLKRLFIRILPPRYMVEHAFRNEMRRSKEPLLLCTWFVGGPFSLGWRTIPNRGDPSHIRSAFDKLIENYYSMPLLARDEYVLKTALRRLQLNADTLRERADLMAEASGPVQSNKRFNVTTHAQV